MNAWVANYKFKVRSFPQSGSCIHSTFQTYTLELVEATSNKKDGKAQCKEFADFIDKTELEYKCKVIYLVTDCDGGSFLGRKLLFKEQPWLLVPSCWGHQVSAIPTCS